MNPAAKPSALQQAARIQTSANRLSLLARQAASQVMRDALLKATSQSR